MSVKILLTTLLVFFGCCFNVLILEHLVTHFSGIANLVTFLQFIFIAIEGFFFTSKCGTKKPPIPVQDCGLLVLLFFISSVCNNYAYNFHVPNTLHIIIKSGSIVTNMSLGIIFKNKHYNIEKYVSASFITIGIILCTLASAKNTSGDFDNLPHNFFYWCIGVALLIIALLISASMGLIQESLYKRCGKHPNDVLYYTHLLPLPLFIFLKDDLLAAAKICSESTLVNITIIGIPSAWLLLTGSVFTQYLCIRSVYTLTSECTSLTVTLLLTLRKFLSLILSVIFFNNAFTFPHWIGSLFIFIGTLLFFDVFKYDKLKIN